MRTIHKLLVLSLLALISFAFSTANMSMSAADPMLSVTQQAVNPTPIVAMDGGVCATAGNTWESGDTMLPLNRWGDVSSFHTRLSTGTLGTGNLAERIQKQGVATMFMSAGNIMWKGAAGLTVMADRFCIGEEVFKKIDGMAGIVGNSLMSGDRERPSVAAIFVVFGLAAAVWAASRGQDAKKKIASTLIGVTLLSVMVAGATATKNGNPVAGSSFGFASPGWFSSAINSTISTVASVPAQALNDSIPEIEQGTSNVDSAQHCYYYISKLEEQYKWWYTTGGRLQGNAVVPMSLNSMWKSTGLRVFTDAQFGSRNDFGDKVNCRYLDAVSGVPVGKGAIAGSDISTWGQYTVTSELGGGGAIGDQTAPFKLFDDKRIDAAMVAWAACNVNAKGGWSVSPDWVSANARGEIKVEHCEKFFTNKDNTNKDDYDHDKSFKLKEFDFEDDGKNIQGPPSTVDFMTNWHGTANTTAIGIVMLFAVISIVIFVVFGIMALAVLVSKIGLLMMTLLLMVVVVASILPGDSSNNRIAQVFKQYIGMAIMAFGASLMIAIVAVITNTLQELGTSMGSGSVIAIIWSAVSPAVAIFMLHYLFTKVFKAPSPFKPSSGMGFAQAAAGGAVGGAVGGGFVGRQMRRARYNAESKMADRFRRGRGGAARRSGGGPDTSRAGGMGAVGAAGAGAATAAASVGPGAGRKKLREDADQSALPDEQFRQFAGDPLATAQDLKAEAKAEQKTAYTWADGLRADAKKQKRGETIRRTSDATAAGVQTALHGTRNAWGKASAATAQTKTRRVEGKNADGSRYFSGTEQVKRGALARNGETLARMGAAGAGAGLAVAGRGIKSAAGGVKNAAAHPIRTTKRAAAAARSGAGAVRGGMASAGAFAQRHRTAITAAALGAATVATAGITAPLAAGYLAKKGADRVRGRQSPLQQQQRALDMANYRKHMADQTSVEVQRRNDAAMKAQREKVEAEDATKATAQAQQAAQDADEAEQRAAGQEPLPMGDGPETTREPSPFSKPQGQEPDAEHEQETLF